MALPVSKAVATVILSVGIVGRLGPEDLAGKALCRLAILAAVDEGTALNPQRTLPKESS